MEEIKSMLLRERDNITKDIMKLKEENTIEHEIGDEIDSSVEEQERELHLLLQDRDRVKLDRINEALKRIEEGDYGVCEECGETISKKRLMVVPFARLCINCQKEEERVMGFTTTIVDDSGSRLLSSMEE